MKTHNGNDAIRFHEVLRSLIEKNSYKRNRAPIWRALNISSAALSQYVSGEARPRLEVLVSLAEFFGVSLDYLVLGKRSEPQISDESRVMVRHFDGAVANLRSEVGMQAWLTARVAEALSSKVQSEVEKVTKSPNFVAGIVSDEDMLVLEQNSYSTDVLTRDLQFDLVIAGGEFALGTFSQVVARNLMLPEPRGYRFLIERSPRWKFAVAQFKEMLCNRLNVGPERLAHCEFRSTTSRILGGLTIYKLDVDQLRIDAPMLLFGLESFMTADHQLVFTTRPNAILSGDILHSSAEASATLLAFQEMWDTGQIL